MYDCENHSKNHSIKYRNSIGRLEWNCYISSMKSKTATIFVSGNECLFLSTSFFLALLHGGSVPIIVGTMNNYVNFLFEIKTQPGVLLRPKR